MTPEKFADILVRAACFLAAAFFVVAALLSAGRGQIILLIIAAPFVVAGLAPRTLGPSIAKGVMVVATIYAFYDPPSSVGFDAGRFAQMLPFFAVALMLGFPALPQGLARLLMKERGS